MKNVFRVGMLFCLKNFHRNFRTSNIWSSTTSQEHFQAYISMAKNRLNPGNWPETQLGPINDVNPRCPLPGNVGLLEASKEIVSLIPAALNLPFGSSEHYTSIMVQAENYLDEVDTAIKALVPDIDSNLECNVRICPQLIKSDLMNLFPSKDFSVARMTAITFCHQTETQAVENIDYVFELFIQAAIDVCSSLKNLGYWADFIHPISGMPFLRFHSDPSLSHLNNQLTNFGFVVDNEGCCKILRSQHFDGRLFIGIIFTDAPIDHPVLTYLSNPQGN